jgi:hypothetical protein
MQEKNMPSDLFDQPPEKVHEGLGNDIEQWLLRADALHRAGEILYCNIGEPPTANPDIEEAWDWFSVHDIGRMLRGMALECLIKATWLAAGELLVENERFVGILGTKSHDLYGMYVVVCKKHKTLLNEEEKKLLARFSYAIISARYPISKSPRGNYPSAPTSRYKMQWNKWSHQEDSALFESLWSKLSDNLREYRTNA